MPISIRTNERGAQSCPVSSTKLLSFSVPISNSFPFGFKRFFDNKFYCEIIAEIIIRLIFKFYVQFVFNF